MLFAFATIVIAILLGWLYIYVKRKYSYWKEKGVPHRQPTFPFGNLLAVVFTNESPSHFFARLYNEFKGPYVGFYSLLTPYLLVKDPQIIKKILIKDFSSFPNRIFYTNEKIDPMFSYALFTTKVPLWKELRKKLSPVFTSGKIKMMTLLMEDCGKELEKYISSQAGQIIEMKEIASRYTTDVIASCAFGINGNCFSDNSTFNFYGKMIFPSGVLDALRALSYLFAPIFVKIFKYPFINRTGANYFCQVFKDTMKEREISKTKRNDLVDILNEIKNTESSDTDLSIKFEGDLIMAQAIIFFGAALDTTSSTIGFALHELSLNTDIQDKLRQEILEKIKKHGGVTYEAIQEMKYLDMVVFETLRKYPVTPLLNREAIQDYLEEDTGLLIEKGTRILISQMALHWDKQFFPNPEKYDPERFNEDNKNKICHYAYLPFGDGPRNCIGERFALLSTKMGIIHVLRSFKVNKNSQTREPIIFSRTGLLRSKYGIPISCTKI